MNFLTSQSTGVQYYTGQFFYVKQITEAGHKKVQQGSRQMYDVLHKQGHSVIHLSKYFPVFQMLAISFFHFFHFFM